MFFRSVLISVVSPLLSKVNLYYRFREFVPSLCACPEASRRWGMSHEKVMNTGTYEFYLSAVLDACGVWRLVVCGSMIIVKFNV